MDWQFCGLRFDEGERASQLEYAFSETVLGGASFFVFLLLFKGLRTKANSGALLIFSLFLGKVFKFFLEGGSFLNFDVSEAGIIISIQTVLYYMLSFLILVAVMPGGLVLIAGVLLLIIQITTRIYILRPIVSIVIILNYFYWSFYGHYCSPWKSIW